MPVHKRNYTHSQSDDRHDDDNEDDYHYRHYHYYYHHRSQNRYSIFARYKSCFSRCLHCNPFPE